jgi:hypothetical protein
VTPTKFRKKPVVVDAKQFTGDNHTDLCDWLAGAPHEHLDDGGYEFDPHTGRSGDGGEPDGTGVLVIRTLEGDTTAKPGWWVIRGIRGEHYPCDPDIFAATYEPAGDQP